MCAQTNQNEKQVLSFSAFLALGFAVGGLTLGWFVGSLVIMFDGVYSLVSLLLTLLSLAASRYIQKPSKSHFPLGKAILEPVVIAIKAITILMIVGYSVHSAALAMFSGGREVDASIATAFGVVNVLGCGYAWWYIANKSKHFSSGLIKAESKQWQMDTLLSVAVTLGFVVAWLMTFTALSGYSVYADPMMMLLMSFYFIKVPFDMLKDAVKELLTMTPNHELCETVDRDIVAVDKEIDQDMDIELAAVTKVGNELRVSVDIHTSREQINTCEIEKTRNALTKRLSKLPLDLQLTMNLAS
ncbi:cation diffusion facilitator family transporter [Vibrio sp. ZSDE26]|uniref:Cation diffusion facilitator family transporter n=1 Tax=Vibrio amylolyticus TaxID=2847292 RepID=A0A9X1XMM0_9VIBR|nr:cation diffusion facilitator family transporter [Vibrio amylolyticus]MCK6265697.1 cation diffusion facilitator family transporter [Vibrio amylolyticus]